MKELAPVLNMDNIKDPHRYFVATTALEEFWDTSYPMVFLGDWCKRYSRRSYWGTIKSTTLQSVVPEEQGLFEAIDYLQGVYERLLPVMARILNNLHGVGFSNRYWRIVIGPWLLCFLHTLHDKYSQIMTLRQQYPDFTTYCLDESCFVVPDDTLMFITLLKADPYNLQLYSELFDFFGYQFPRKKTVVDLGPHPDMRFFVRPPTILSTLARRFSGLVYRADFGRKEIIFTAVNFHKSNLLKLMFQMKGKFWPYISERKKVLNPLVNQDMRKKIADIKFGDNEYERMLLPLIGKGIPKCALEGFSTNRARIRRKCSRPPKGILSANGWYCHEEFKMFAAESAENKTVLLGTQHGSGYGMLKYCFPEEHELSIVDKYFSWGWTRKDCYAKVEPISAAKLIKKKRKKKDKRSRDILYVTNAFYRYTIAYPQRIEFCKNYGDQQSIFLSSLSPGIKERLVIRPMIDDGGIDFKERFMDIIPDVKIETWRVPFDERDYALLVCDHPCQSTTFIESLAVNKPTILFTDPSLAANRFNERAQPYWDRLKEIGIAYDDPLSASKTIGDIYENVDDWWNQSHRQEGIRFFLSGFGRVSDQWNKEWVGVLTRILR